MSEAVTVLSSMLAVNSVSCAASIVRALGSLPTVSVGHGPRQEVTERASHRRPSITDTGLPPRLSPLGLNAVPTETVSVLGSYAVAAGPCPVGAEPSSAVPKLATAARWWTCGGLAWVAEVGLQVPTSSTMPKRRVGSRFILRR